MSDVAELNWKGLALPFKGTVATTFDTKQSAEILATSVAMCVLTHKGERVMLPEFGSDVEELLFDPQDDTLIREIQEQVADAIRLWDDRIDIKKIEVTFDYDNRTTNVRLLIQNVQDPKRQAVLLELDLNLATL